MYKITISNGATEKILHEPDTLSRNRLSSGKFSEEVNQIPSFDFTIPASNPCYMDELNDRKDVVTILNTLTNEIEFEGTLLTHSGSIDQSKCVAETPPNCCKLPLLFTLFIAFLATQYKNDFRKCK